LNVTLSALKPFFITSSAASYPVGLLPLCPPARLYPACPHQASLPSPSKKMSRDCVLLLSLLPLSFPCVGLCSAFASPWQSLPSLPLQTLSVSKLFSVGMEVKIQLETVKSTGLAISTPHAHHSVRHERERVTS